MLDARHAGLAIVVLGMLTGFILTMDACRHAMRRGALEWRRGRLLRQAHHPGPFRLGISLMHGVGLGFAYGAVHAATALLDIAP